jgi:hypothetical protein
MKQKLQRLFRWRRPEPIAAPTEISFDQVVELARKITPIQRVAQFAADDVMEGSISRIEIRDVHQPDIIVGHMLVMVLVGSDRHITAHKRMALSVPGTRIVGYE